MKTTKMMAIVAVLAFGMVFGLGGTATAVTIDTVPVGNPGNANDTEGDGYGSVAYTYDIGKYEVTADQYAAFLNDVAATDTYALYNAGMANTTTGCGISQSGGIGTYSYTVTGGFENRPVNYTCWYDAIRFANWMTSGTTETGSYTITGGGANSGTVAIPTAAQRATWAAGTTAYWLLTSEDEWYKAAYYDPAGPTYFDYPTGSNTAPTGEAPPGTDFVNGSANYNNAVGSPTTVVGSYNAKPSDSPYGTFDQAGNVWEWNEALIDATRGLRGGCLHDADNTLLASNRLFVASTFEHSVVGFRVSEVGVEALPIPEPGSFALLALGLGGMLGLKRRK